MFKDVWLKTIFYKEEIEKDLIRKGLYNESAENRLKEIDAHLSLFRHENVLSGNTFDAVFFSKQMKRIYTDLKFLLLLLKNEIIDEYQRINGYAEAHLQGLESLMERYEGLYQMEIGSSHLGKTILYQARGFKSTTTQTGIQVNLGQVRTNAGRRLVGLAEIDNVQHRYLRFVFESQTEKHLLSHHHHFRETLTIPGMVESTRHTIVRPIDHPENQPLAFQTDTPPEKNKRSIVYAGKNQLLTKQLLQTSTMPADSGRVISVSQETDVSFWLVGGNQVEMTFTRPPVAGNLGGKHRHTLSAQPRRLQFTVPANTGFRIETDADIYAETTVPLLFDTYYVIPSTRREYREYLLEVTGEGELKMYNVFLEVQDHFIPTNQIRYAAIKEIH